MNRRGFLGALLALGAAPVLAKLAVFEPIVQASQMPEALPLLNELLCDGDGLLNFLDVANYAPYPWRGEPMAVQLLRKSGDLVMEWAVAPGGRMVWSARSTGAIVFLRKEPLIIRTPPLLEVRAVYTDLDGYDPVAYYRNADGAHRTPVYPRQ